MTQPTLNYETPQQAKLSRLKRAVRLVGIALALTPVAGAMVDPATARSLIRDLLRENLYEVAALALVMLVYYPVRKHNASRQVKVSYLAVVSALAAFLNPEVVHVLFRATGLPWMGRGDSEMRSFLWAVGTLVAGVIACIRIHNSEGTLTGTGFAVAGLIGAALWIGGWIVVLLVLVNGLRGF